MEEKNNALNWPARLSPAMILLLSAEDAALWSPADLAAALELLPAPLRAEAQGCTRWQERQGRILGRLLLRQGLARLGFQELADLRGWRLDALGRPRLEGLPADFSISHTKGLAVCAICPGGRVGVDVEPRALTNAERLRAFFTEAEWDVIQATVDPPKAAALLWTAKEAALKADGRGLSLSPFGIDARSRSILIGEVSWHVSRPDVGGDWTCALASEHCAPSITSVAFNLGSLVVARGR